jgi:hypothetical protein
LRNTTIPSMTVRMLLPSARTRRLNSVPLTD